MGKNIASFKIYNTGTGFSLKFHLTNTWTSLLIIEKSQSIYRHSMFWGSNEVNILKYLLEFDIFFNFSLTLLGCLDV